MKWQSFSNFATSQDLALDVADPRSPNEEEAKFYPNSSFWDCIILANKQQAIHISYVHNSQEPPSLNDVLEWSQREILVWDNTDSLEEFMKETGIVDESEGSFKQELADDLANKFMDILSPEAFDSFLYDTTNDLDLLEEEL